MSILIESNYNNLFEILKFKQNLTFKEILNCKNQDETINLLNEYKSSNPIVAILIHIEINNKNLKCINEIIDKKIEIIKEFRDKRKMNSFIVVYIDYDKNEITSKSTIQEINNEVFPLALSRLFKNGCSLVCNKLEDIIKSVNIVSTTSINQSGIYNCPICCQSGFAINLSKDDLREHIYLFHCNLSLEVVENKIRVCPICNERPIERMGVHLHEAHGPDGEKTESQLSLSKIYAFCLVIVRKKSDNTYLLVNEAAGRGYWLPGGKINVGESLQNCAIRETKEETGIDIELKGILRVEYSPMAHYSRMRVIFYAEPKDENQSPRLIPNYESMGAIYVQPKDLSSFTLRGKEPLIWFNYVDKNKPIHPLSLLGLENSLPIVEFLNKKRDGIRDRDFRNHIFDFYYNEKSKYEDLRIFNKDGHSDVPITHLNNECKVWVLFSLCDIKKGSVKISVNVFAAPGSEGRSISNINDHPANQPCFLNFSLEECSKAHLIKISSGYRFRNVFVWVLNPLKVEKLISCFIHPSRFIPFETELEKRKGEDKYIFVGFSKKPDKKVVYCRNNDTNKTMPIKINCISSELTKIGINFKDYLMGCSYEADSLSRDYTINALYIEPFNPMPFIPL